MATYRVVTMEIQVSFSLAAAATGPSAHHDIAVPGVRLRARDGTVCREADRPVPAAAHQPATAPDQLGRNAARDGIFAGQNQSGLTNYQVSNRLGPGVIPQEIELTTQHLPPNRNVFPAALDWLIQNDSTARLFNCDKSAAIACSSAATMNQIHGANSPANESPSGAPSTGGGLHRGRKRSNAGSDSRSASTPSSVGNSLDEEEDAFEAGDDNDKAANVSDPFTVCNVVLLCDRFLFNERPDGGGCRSFHR